LIEALREGIREHRPVMVEILNYRKNGVPFRNAVMVAPLFDGEGKLEYFLGSQMEIVGDTGGCSPMGRVQGYSNCHPANVQCCWLWRGGG
jgi:hypothetical protein